MAEYINREEAIQAAKAFAWGDNSLIVERMQTIPAADVIERKKGKWKEYDFPVLGKRKHCSACGFIKIGSDEKIYNFCPNCGADMRGVDNG